MSGLAALCMLLAAACTPNLPDGPPPGQARPAETGPASGPSALPPAAPVAPARAEPIRVGLLLPLSGRFESVGQGLLEAAEMAVFDHADVRFTLLPRDTAGAADSAAASARSLADQGAALLIGPVFAGPLKAVRPVAEANGLSLIGFSTDSRLEAPGIYIFGFDPDDEVRRIVGFAASQSKPRVAALLPAGPYGDIVAGALPPAVAAHQGTLVRTVRYHPDPFDIEAGVRKLLGLSLAQVKSRRERGQTVAGNLDFDAVLLVATGEPLTLILKEFARNGLDKAGAQMLSTAQWADLTPEHRSSLIGAWYAAPSEATRAGFRARFLDLYGREPPRLASLGYDAVKLSADLASRVPEGGERGYRFGDLAGAESGGVNGAVRLRAGGRVDRSLAVFEVDPAGDRLRDPAPLSAGEPLF